MMRCTSYLGMDPGACDIGEGHNGAACRGRIRQWLHRDGLLMGLAGFCFLFFYSINRGGCIKTPPRLKD